MKDRIFQKKPGAEPFLIQYIPEVIPPAGKEATEPASGFE
jgi:hypothetical protein